MEHQGRDIQLSVFMHFFLVNANASTGYDNAIELGISFPYICHISWSPSHSENGTWNELHISRRRRRKSVGDERSTSKVGFEVDHCGN
jgi:hypothetical protein